MCNHLIYHLICFNHFPFQHYLKVKGIHQEYGGNRYVNLIANHIIDRRVLSNQWQTNLLIPSRLQGNVLRINKFSSGVSNMLNRRCLYMHNCSINASIFTDGNSELSSNYSQGSSCH